MLGCYSVPQFPLESMDCCCPSWLCTQPAWRCHPSLWLQEFCSFPWNMPSQAQQRSKIRARIPPGGFMPRQGTRAVRSWAGRAGTDPRKGKSRSQEWKEQIPGWQGGQEQIPGWQGGQEQPSTARSRSQAGRRQEWDGGGQDGCQELQAPGTEAGELLEPSWLPNLDGWGEQDPPQPSGFSSSIPVQRIPWIWGVGAARNLPIPAAPRAESRLIFGNVVAVERGSCIQEQGRSCLECSGSSAMGTFLHGDIWVAALALLRMGSGHSWVFFFSPQEIGWGFMDTKCSAGNLG